MSIKKVSIQKRIRAKMKKIENKESKKVPNNIQMKVSPENLEILMEIRDRLETLYEKEMAEENITRLTLDDAISSILVIALIEWGLPMTMMATTSRYARVATRKTISTSKTKE
jgi:hypothetical protein